MLRSAIRGVAILIPFAAVLDSASRAQQPGAPDRIYYRDKKDGSIKQVEGELKAAPPVGYQVVSDKKVVATVSPADLIRVVPADIPGFDRKTVLDVANLSEDKKDWEKAKLAHQEMLKKSGNAPEKVRRYLEFRQAIAAAKASDDPALDEAIAQAKAEEAVKFLDSFLNANKTGWEVWPTAQTCARLQMGLVEKKTEKVEEKEKVIERRMFEEAARTWGKAAKNPDLPPDLRLEAGLQEIDVKIRARLYSEAAALIDEALKTAPAGPVKERLGIFKLAVKFGENPNPTDGVAPIEAELAKTKDPAVRATGFGMLGELYLAADKPRDAMWQFLWVEVVYNQDRDEVIKSLIRLGDAFRMQGDEDRAKTYRDKLRRYRGAL